MGGGGEGKAKRRSLRGGLKEPDDKRRGRKGRGISRKREERGWTKRGHQKREKTKERPYVVAKRGYSLEEE